MLRNFRPPARNAGSRAGGDAALPGTQIRSCQFRGSTIGSSPNDSARNGGMSSSGKTPRLASAKFASSSATVFTPMTTEETAFSDKQKRSAASARLFTSWSRTART